MTQCSKCGARIEGVGKFCSNCGTSQAGSASQSPSEKADGSLFRGVKIIGAVILALIVISTLRDNRPTNNLSSNYPNYSTPVNSAPAIGTPVGSAPASSAPPQHKSGNVANDRMLAIGRTEQATALGYAVGEGCHGVRAFYMGTTRAVAQHSGVCDAATGLVTPCRLAPTPQAARRFSNAPY